MLLEKHLDLHRFVKMLISHCLHLARLMPARDVGLSLNQLLRQAKIRPRGVKLDQPDWSDHAHSLAFTALGLDGGTWARPCDNECLLGAAGIRAAAAHGGATPGMASLGGYVSGLAG